MQQNESGTRVAAGGIRLPDCERQTKIGVIRGFPWMTPTDCHVRFDSEPVKSTSLANPVELAEEAQDLRRGLVRDRENRQTRLRQNLSTGQVRRFFGEVGIDDLAAGV